MYYVNNGNTCIHTMSYIYIWVSILRSKHEDGVSDINSFQYRYKTIGKQNFEMKNHFIGIFNGY